MIQVLYSTVARARIDTAFRLSPTFLKTSSRPYALNDVKATITLRNEFGGEKPVVSSESPSNYQLLNDLLYLEGTITSM
jgi:hypothetical protein